MVHISVGHCGHTNLQDNISLIVSEDVLSPNLFQVTNTVLHKVTAVSTSLLHRTCTSETRKYGGENQ